MRVLQLHTHYREPGGEDIAVATEAKILSQAGHDVQQFQVTNPDGGGRAALRLASAPWNPAAARDVEEIATSFKPDVAHVHNLWFSLSPSVLLALQRLNVPVVMTLHNYRLICAAATLFRDGAPCRDCVGTHPWHAVAHRCYRGSAAASAAAAASMAIHDARRTWHRDVDHFLALTEFGRKQFIDDGLSPDRISVHSNSVADPGPRLNPPSASNTVLFVGRLSEEKGLLPLLEAWRSVPEPFELIIMGEGPLGARLRHDSRERVRFLGQRSSHEVTARMLEARALVFPSILFEGQGLVALEAAAAGLPVFLSNHGAMSELFAPGTEDLLMTPNDGPGIAKKLLQLSDEALMDVNGTRHRSRFEERYTHSMTLQRLERIYAAVQR